jgi:hypothetical protein
VAAVVVLAGVGVLLYFLVFSGDDDLAGDYCSVLDENRATFEQFSGGADFDAEELGDAVGKLHELREAAPEEVADEWAQLDDPFVELEAAMDEAGLDWGDIGGDDPPPELEDAAQKFLDDIGALDRSAIGQTLSDHAKEECDIDLQE